MVKDAVDSIVTALILENYKLKQENQQLRAIIPLLKRRLDSFFIWFQGTVEGIH